MNISSFSEMEKLMRRRELKIGEISRSLQKFMFVDDSMAFVIDPVYKNKALPFIEQIKNHRKANAEVTSAIENAHNVYFEHFKRHNDEPITALENDLFSVQHEIEQKKNALQHLTQLDSELKPSVPEDSSDKASELRQDILFNLPGKVKVLETLIEKIRSPFQAIVLPPLPVPGYGLPTNTGGAGLGLAL